MTKDHVRGHGNPGSYRALTVEGIMFVTVDRFRFLAVMASRNPGQNDYEHYGRFDFHGTPVYSMYAGK
jgi:hypothetical protein